MKRWLSILLALSLTAFGLSHLEARLATTAGADPAGATSDPASGVSTPSLSLGEQCSAPVGQTQLLDVDANHGDPDPILWPLVRGEPKLVLYIERQLTDEATWAATQKAAQIWNVSPCVEVRVVEKCPLWVRCVPLKAVPASAFAASEDPFRVAEFLPRLSTDGYIRGGELRINPADLEKWGVLDVVMTHEVGHALGLRHRLTQGDAMYFESKPNTKSPDRADFDNLAWLYGAEIARKGAPK